MRKVYAYWNGSQCPVNEFFKKADEKIRKKFRFQLEYITDEKNPFCEPYVKHFSMDKYKELYEFRIKAANTMVRILFYEYHQEILLLHAVYKWGKHDIEKALEHALQLLGSVREENGEIREECKGELAL